MRRFFILCLFACCLQFVTACSYVKGGGAMVDDYKDGYGKPDGYYAKEVMIAYEQSIIEAINQNKFSLVEGLLDEDGPLYQDQQRLVKHLNEKKIKEKLIRYQIRSIQKTNGVYKFYIVENTELYQPDREPEVNEYYWIYTVIENPEKKEAKVHSIEKWNR